MVKKKKSSWKVAIADNGKQDRRDGKPVSWNSNITTVDSAAKSYWLPRCRLRAGREESASIPLKSFHPSLCTTEPPRIDP